MITLKFKGESPRHIREEVKTVLGLVEPHEGTPEAAQQVVDEVTGAAAETAAAPIPVAVADKPKPRGRSKKESANPSFTPAATVEAPPEVVDVADMPKQAATDDLEPPAFLDRRPKAEEKPAVATLDELRAALSKLLASPQGKNNADLVMKLIGTCKQPDGKPCVKASQVAEGDRAKLIADIEALLAGK